MPTPAPSPTPPESAAGAQHPTFSYDLKGNGDLVLTEPGGYHESLLVPAAAPAGTYYIVRGDVIAAEVVKAPGESKRIALRPDRYVVKRRLADRLRIGPVNIAQGTRPCSTRAGCATSPSRTIR
jgi:hypothetical protein